jgi:hypothetical protein
MLAARGEQREVFADADAGGLRGDGGEFATNVVGRVGLGIEAVVLAESARKEDVDRGLVARRRRAGCALSGGCMQARDVVHSEAEQADRAGLDGGAARELRV